MEVTIKVPDRLAEEARAQGVPLEVYVQQILMRQGLETTDFQHREAARSAIARIVELRQENKLAGLRTKDLIHEGHKL